LAEGSGAMNVLVSLLLGLAILFVVDAFRFGARLRTSTHLCAESGKSTATSSLFEDDEDGVFKKVVTNYLLNRYRDCREGVEGSVECRFSCDPAQIEAVVKSILPPVTPTELQKEVDRTMSKFGGLSVVSEDVFTAALLENTYWEKAGPLVVKELILLDCIHAYYYDKQMFLADEDYNELKEMLTWEGSDVANMKGKEALFVTAVAANKRGQTFMSDEEYESLKI